MDSKPQRTGRFALAFAITGLGLTALTASACDPTVTFGQLDDGGTTSAGSTSSGNSVPQGAECTDVLVADVGESVHDLVADDGWLYYVQDLPWEEGVEDDRLSDVLRVRLTGGAPEVLVDDASYVENLVVDGDRVFWSERKGAIRSAALDGSDVQLVSQLTVETHAVSIAVGDGVVYWGQLDGAIRKTASTGGAAIELRPAAPLVIALEMQLAGDTLYLLDTHFSAQDVVSIPTSGGPSTLVLEGTLHWVNIKLHGTDLYLVDLGASLTGADPGQASSGVGTILKIDTTGTAPVALVADGGPFPDSVAIDESGIYWGGGIAGSFDGAIDSLAYARRVGPTSAGTNVSALGVYWSVTECEGAICWYNATAERIERYRECVP